MNHEPREAPPGLYMPSSTSRPFDPVSAVLWALVVSVVAGVLAGWRIDDWRMGGVTAGSLYALAVLTIIALKE